MICDSPVKRYIAEYAVERHRSKCDTQNMRNRIKALREAQGLSQTELGDAVGVHWQTIQRLESGATRLDTAWMERLAKPLKVQPIEILTDQPGVRLVEVIGQVQAGAWTEAWEWPHDDRYNVPIPDDSAWQAFRLIGAETRGPSMNQRYPEGTVVVVTDYSERGAALQVGRRYLIERERVDGLREMTVKKLWRDEDGTYWLLPESDDPRFQEPIPVDGADGETIRILGRVVYAVQKEP